jgi:hypothetical protein
MKWNKDLRWQRQSDPEKALLRKKRKTLYTTGENPLPGYGLVTL